MIGIDISDRSVKVVQVTNDSHPQLLAYCWHGIAEGLINRGVITDAETLTAELKAALHKCSIAPNLGDPVVASIPETQSFLRVIEVPSMPDAEISEAIQWEIAQHIPFGIENVYIDWQPIPRGHTTASSRQEILVGAAEKKVVDPLVACLQALNLDVAALELESQAVVRSLISPELRQKKGLLVVDLGGTATNVVIHDHGTIRFTASLNRGANDILAQLPPEQLQVIAGPPKDVFKGDLDAIAQNLQAGFEESVIEIHGIVEFYSRLDADHRVMEVLLTGGGANLPGLDTAFLRHFDDVHIQRGNPWVNLLPPEKVTNPPLGLQESVHYSTALGLVLRPVVR